MSRAGGRMVRYWLEERAGPFHFERLITVTLAVAGLLTAVVSYLAVNAATNNTAASRNTERYAILTASQNVQGQARYNCDYFGAFLLWQDLNYQALLSAAGGDTEKADRLRQARDAIQDQSALLQPPYNTSLTSVTGFPGYYLGSPELVAYSADLYVGPAAETQERYSLASLQRDAWSNEGTAYVRILAFLGVALLLLGLSTPLPRTFRTLFYSLGLVVAVGAGYNAGSVYFSKIPKVSEAAIEAYSAGAGSYEKSLDEPARLNDAIDSWTKAIAAQHDYGHAYLSRANAYAGRASDEKATDAPTSRKDYDASLADYDAAARYSGDELTVAQQAYAARGRVLYGLGRLDEAASADRKALNLSPNQTSVRFQLMLALLASGDLTGAQHEFDTSISVARQNAASAGTQGTYASPIVFFDLDRAAVSLRAVSDRIASGDRGGGSAPPLKNIPADKRDAITDKADELYTLARSNAVALDRHPPELSISKPAGIVTSVQPGQRGANGQVAPRKALPPLSKQVTLLMAYDDLQPGQRLSLRIYYYGQLEETQLRREVTWTGPASGTYEWDLSYADQTKSIAPGDYKVEVYLENYLVGTGSFSVQTNLQ